MEWKTDLTPEEIKKLQPWMWALNTSNPNAPPLWNFIVPLFFTPLTVYLFLRFTSFVQPTSMSETARDWIVYALVSTLAGFTALPFVPLLKRYIYGRDKQNMMPKIGLRKEQVVKVTFLTVMHFLSSALTAWLFLGWTSRGWIMDDWWTKTWVMALASLPGLLPTLLTVIAKIKLVSTIRAKKRAEGFA